MAFGTVFTLDTVAQTRTTIADMGEGDIWANLDGYFAAHNELFNQVLENVAERTTDRQRRYGATADLEAQELDEFGQPSAQKLTPTGYNIGFPLRRYGTALQWTRFAFENMTTEEFQKQVNAITAADEKRLYRALRQAIFRPINTTFSDWMQTPVLELEVKALLNGDGRPVPTGPSATTFDGATHTHYTGITTANAPTQGQVETFIENIIEHFNSGNVVVYINRAEEADVRGFADFKEYLDARLVNQSNAVIAAGALDMRNLYNRSIGLLHGAEFHVKPWIPAGYFFAFAVGPDRPLVLRQPVPQTARDLRLVAEDENYPLRAREWEHRYGVGIFNRANGAVLDTVTGGGTYTAPAL